MAHAARSSGYFLTLFKTEGHAQWRASLKGDEQGFERDMQGQAAMQHKQPVITEKKVYRIDRITGEIKEHGI